MEGKWLTISLNFELLEEKKLPAVELAGFLFPFELLAFELLEERKLSAVELAGLLFPFELLAFELLEERKLVFELEERHLLELDTLHCSCSSHK